MPDHTTQAETKMTSAFNRALFVVSILHGEQQSTGTSHAFAAAAGGGRAEQIAGGL